MAIAFDAASSGTSGSGTTLTISHTASGVNPILWVGIVGSSDTDNVTGVTYNGVSGTRVGTTIFQTRYFYLYYVKGVTGTANIVVTNSGSGDTYMSASCGSWSGASQTGIPDATVQATNAATSVSATITTVADNCFVVGYTAGQGYDVTSIDTGGTIRSQANAFVALFDSTTAKTPAGSKTMTANWSGSTNHAIILASFAPGTAPVANPNFLAFM